MTSQATKPDRPHHTDGHWRTLYAASAKRRFYLIRLPDAARYRLEKLGKRGVAVLDNATFNEALMFLDNQLLPDADESLPAWLTRLKATRTTKEMDTAS